MIENHVTCVQTLIRSTGGHVDQEVGPKSRSTSGKYQWAAVLDVKKQNGDVIVILIHWYTAAERQEMSGKCLCLHRYSSLLLLCGKLLPSMGWGCSLHLLVRQQLPFVVCLGTSGVNRRCESHYITKDLVVFYLKFYSKRRLCQWGPASSPMFVIHRACVLFGHSWENVVISSVYVLYVRRICLSGAPE